MDTQLKAFGALLLSLPVIAEANIHTCSADSINREIAQQYQSEWQQAVASRDTASISRIYNESAVLMPPEDDSFVGRRPIADYLSDSALPAQAKDISIDIVSCEMEGNTLHITGVWGLNTADSNGPWQSGNMMRVLENDGLGNWRASYEIWN